MLLAVHALFMLKVTAPSQLMMAMSLDIMCIDHACVYCACCGQGRELWPSNAIHVSICGNKLQFFKIHIPIELMHQNRLMEV